MASPTNAVMRGEAQLLVQDTSTTSAGLTSAQWTTLLNISLRWFYDNTEKRVKTQQTFVTVASGDTETASTATFPEILQVYRDAGGAGATNNILDRMSWSEIRYRQFVDSTSGIPQNVACVKQAGSGVNTWKVALFPIPNAAFVLVADVRDYPTALSGDSDVVELGDHEARIVVILAAILAAPLLGRPDLADSLAKQLPQMLQDKLVSFVTHDEIKTTERGAA